MTDLLADIGGTNSRIAFRDPGAPWPRVYHRRSAAFRSLRELLADVIEEAHARPSRAFVALPGPVVGDAAALTNLPWRVGGPALARDLGLGQVTLLNDLEAVARALPHLSNSDLSYWREGYPAPGAPRTVIAPGTGLGVSALAPSGRGWSAVASEGGHARALLPRAAPKILSTMWDNDPTWEDLLSGPGLLRMFRALGGTADAPAEVTSRAAAGDLRAQEAIGFFSELLGVCAGEFATIFAAKGGCFVAGGVVPALGPLFDSARFVEAFTGTRTPARDIPLALIVHPAPGLVGLASLADVMDRATGPAS